MLRNMEQLIGEQKARELRIDATLAARESWELILLKGFFDSPYARDLIFRRGGSFLDWHEMNLKNLSADLIKDYAGRFPEYLQRKVEAILKPLVRTTRTKKE
jgi:hypothetical protein